MGIPRLSRDLEPYAETIVLGKQSREGHSASEVTRIVIDGPSLVYHIYNALIHSNDDFARELLGELPSYININACLRQFLLDVQGCGVKMYVAR